MYVKSQAGYDIFVFIFDSVSKLPILRNLLTLVWEWFYLGSRGCNVTKDFMRLKINSIYSRNISGNKW